MPLMVCSVCLAQRAAGMELEAAPALGYLTMIDGTYYCEDHIPKLKLAEFKKLPLRKAPEVSGKGKRGRPRRAKK